MGMFRQRREPRLRTDWDLTYEKIPDTDEDIEHIMSNSTVDDGQELVGKVSDMSVNGCRVVGYPLPLASRVACLIEIPKFRTVEAIGLVVWRRPDSFGLIFEWISLEVRQEIKSRTQLLA